MSWKDGQPTPAGRALGVLLCILATVIMVLVIVYGLTALGLLAGAR